MAIIPKTSAVPNPALVFMPGTSPAPPAATAAAPPAPTPLPPSAPAPADSAPPAPPSSSSSSSSPPDGGGADFPLPTLRLEVRDLAHPGADRFLASVNAAALLRAAVGRVLGLLYVAPPPPPTRSVTVVLRDMPGVAYTTGTDLDRDHKEIHLSLRYVAGIAPAARAAAEVEGVLTHELVHCYQWDAGGSCPGGLVEGVADWVRLRCGLAPPHWNREASGRWDAGYQHTAYFLDYLEGRFGDGTVRRVNEALRPAARYDEKRFWTGLLGRPVEQLWRDYLDSLREEDEGAAGKSG